MILPEAWKSMLQSCRLKRNYTPGSAGRLECVVGEIAEAGTFIKR